MLKQDKHYILRIILSAMTVICWLTLFALCAVQVLQRTTEDMYVYLSAIMSLALFLYTASDLMDLVRDR